MNFNELRMFLSLADTLHFGKAARTSHVSPSALSRAIKRIEDEAGKPLFERDRRTVHLTAEGTAFRDYARTVLEDWDDLQERLNADTHPLQGKLSLFASVTAAYSILPELLDRFTREHPQVTIRIVTGDANTAIDQVLDGAVDGAIAALPEKLPREVRAREITRTPIVMIGPEKKGQIRDALQRDPVRWEEIPMIAPQSGLLNTHFHGWFRQRGSTPRITAQASGHEAILSLVRLGLGAGMIPRIVLDKCLFAPEVEIIPVKPALPKMHVGLCLRTRSLKSPVVDAFWRKIPSGAQKPIERRASPRSRRRRPVS